MKNLLILHFSGSFDFFEITNNIDNAVTGKEETYQALQKNLKTTTLTQYFNSKMNKHGWEKTYIDWKWAKFLFCDTKIGSIWKEIMTLFYLWNESIK